MGGRSCPPPIGSSSFFLSSGGGFTQNGGAVLKCSRLGFVWVCDRAGQEVRPPLRRLSQFRVHGLGGVAHSGEPGTCGVAAVTVAHGN